MTTIIEQLRAAEAEATKGPWRVWSPRSTHGVSEVGPEGSRVAVIRDVRRFGSDGNIDPATEALPAANATLIALARTHMPALLAGIAALQMYDHLSLVIESAVRTADKGNYEATLAAIKSGRAALSALTQETSDANG
jgi:hypothetical protein